LRPSGLATGLHGQGSVVFFITEVNFKNSCTLTIKSLPMELIACNACPAFYVLHFHVLHRQSTHVHTEMRRNTIQRTTPYCMSSAAPRVVLVVSVC